MSIIEGRNAEILQSIIDGEPYENTNPYPSRIEQLLMELKEVIEEGGATVDQTYTPTSENAQSGTAVAEALETIPSVTVDQTFNGTSANAQSGTAVAQALANVPKLTLIGSINSLIMDMAFEQILTTSEAISSNRLYIVNLEVASSTLSSTVTMTIPIATGFSTKSQFEVRINNTSICDLRIRLSGSNNSSVAVTNRNTSVNATIYLALYKLG